MPQVAKSYPKDSLQDARRKIQRTQYPEIIATYNELHSLQKTADIYGVSKRTIVLIVNPKTLKALKARNKLVQPWKLYYNKEKHTLAIAKYRARKRQFGLLGTNKRQGKPL